MRALAPLGQFAVKGFSGNAQNVRQILKLSFRGKGRVVDQPCIKPLGHCFQRPDFGLKRSLLGYFGFPSSKLPIIKANNVFIFFFNSI